MAGRFLESVNARAAFLAKAIGDGVASIRPRWTYARGPKSRADLIVQSDPPAPVPAKIRLRFAPGALFLGEAAARPRRLHGAGVGNAAPPDPSKILLRGPAPRTLSPRQAEVERSLRADLGSDAGPESGDTAVIAGDLGQALLDRAIASSTESLARIGLWGAGLGAIAFGAGAFFSGGADPFGYGAVYFGAGFIGALMISAAALAAGGSAKARFIKGQQKLASLVERTTGEFQSRLIGLRAGMRPTGGSFGEAIKAAGEARLATIAAMRFFDQAPAAGSAGEGHQCGMLAGKLQNAAKASLSASLLVGGAMLVAAAAAAGYLVLQPGTLAPLLAAEAARPGVALLPLAVGLLLVLPILAGPLIATLKAASDPAALLKTEPLRGMADSLRAAAQTAAVESEADMIAAYADALHDLESKAGSVRQAAATTEDGPAWRQGPDAPRFVGLGFAAVPPAFKADAPKMSLKNLFGGPRPKRS